MKPLLLAGASALAFLLAGCGETQNATSEAPANSSAGEPAHVESIYSASGTVTAIAGDQVTISHGPVQGIGWPAMTMTFRSGSPGLIEGISVGDRVAFDFMQADGGYTLTAVSKQ